MVKDYDWDVFVGPAAGEPAIDFTVTDFMYELVHEFPEGEFLLIYIREAHLGERLHQHRNFAKKAGAARNTNYHLTNKSWRVLITYQ